MRFVTDLNKGILGKPDPVNLWKPLINLIDKSLLLNSSIPVLFPACGHCTEADLLAKRMLALGVTPQEIKDRFILCDKYKVFTNEAKQKGYVSVKRGNFLEVELNKLDGCIVLMNPPYLKRTWVKFVEKVVHLNPSVIATINPDPTSSKSDFGERWRDICRQNGLVHRENVTHHFPEVSSGTISSFILDRSKTANEALFKSDDPLIDSIFEKIITEHPTSFVIRGSQAVAGYGDKSKAHSISETKDDTHIYPSIMHCGNEGLKIKYSNKTTVYKKHAEQMQGRFVIMNRFFGKNNPDPVYEISKIEEYNLSYDCMGYKLEENETLENFMSVYSSKTYRFVMDKMRNGGFDINQSNFMSLIKLDLTNLWTEEKIQTHLKLTDEEIKRIEKDN